MSSKKVIFDSKFLEIMLPGLVASMEALIIKSDSEGPPAKTCPGIMASAAFFSAHCAELLLKYKIQQEGNTITRTHDLFELFNRLNADSQTSIEAEFNRLISILNTVPNGWESAESVFQKARNANVSWRYGVEIDAASFTYPELIYAAALSVSNVIANELAKNVR